MGEEKFFLCSFMTVSLYCCVEEPFTGVMDAATIFPLLWDWTRQKMNFLVWEMSLLHFLAMIKEVVVGGTTSDILYNELPKEIMTARGLDSYTACRLHKYGWPNNTSQTSKGATSHNTSYMKGLMLYGRQHYWWTQRSRPWWSHQILYGCGYGVVGRPNLFTTSVEMRFFWLPLRQWIAAANHSPTSVSGKDAPPPLDLRAHPSGPWWWQQWRWALHQWFASLCHSPCRVLTQGQNMHLILKPSTRPPATAWSDTHLCYEWGSYGTHTTFLCLSSTSWCCSFLVLRRVVLDHPTLALSFGLRICRSKVSLLLFKLLLNFDSISVRRAERGDVQELHLFLDVSV